MVPVVIAVLAAALLVASAGAAAGKPALRFTSLRVVDPYGGNIEAFRLLIPAGWIWRGGVQWNLRYANVASVALRVRNPRGPEAVESYPLIPQIWSDATPLGPIGGNYLGSEVRPPLPAASFLTQLVIPTLRGRLGPSVVNAVPLPRVARQLSSLPADPSTPTTYDAARVRITYRENGRSIEEDFFVGISYARSQLLPGSTIWQPLVLYSFKAGRGQLDRASRILQTVVSSTRPNLRWYAGYRHVVDLWFKGQMQSIQAAGNLSRAISEASDSISRSTGEAWRSQQDAYDRVYASVSEQIRGVETYDDPIAGRPVQLSSDYRYAWVSTSGEYALSNQAGFNPNVGSTVDWRLLRPS